MTDKEEQGDKLQSPPEASPLGSSDAQAIAAPSVQDKQAAETERTNQSDGSLRKFAGIADQELSLELCYGDRVASRTQKVSERELLAKAPKESLAEQSKTIQELEGAAKTNPVAEVLLGFRRQAEAMKPGPDKERLTRLAREQAAELMAPAAADDQDYCGVHEVDPTKGPLTGRLQYPDAKEIEGVTRLTPEDLRKLAKALEVAGPAAETSIKETSDEILRRTGESYKDTVLFGVHAAIGLLEYDRDLLINPDKAREKAAGAGEVLGLLMYHGAVFSIKTGAYAETVRQSGDYSLPLKHLPQALNSWYEQQSPADQMAIMAGVTGGLHLNQALGEVQKLKQPGAFSAFLQEAVERLPRNPEAERRAMETLSWLVKKAEPDLVTSNGPRVKASDILREPEKPITHVEMSNSKDLHGGGHRDDKAKNVKSSEQKKPHEVTNEALDNPEGLTQLAKKFGINMPPRDTYVFMGEKDAVSAETAARRLGIAKEQLENLGEASLLGKNLERVPDYRDAFFNRHPGLIPVADRIFVHHAIPKWVLKEYPGIFTAREINDVESLRGIYRGVNDELHNKFMHNAWKKFLRDNPTATRRQVLLELEELDGKYGHLFVPTEGK